MTRETCDKGNEASPLVLLIHSSGFDDAEKSLAGVQMLPTEASSFSVHTHIVKFIIVQVAVLYASR